MEGGEVRVRKGARRWCDKEKRGLRKAEWWIRVSKGCVRWDKGSKS